MSLAQKVGQAQMRDLRLTDFVGAQFGLEFKGYEFIPKTPEKGLPLHLFNFVIKGSTDKRFKDGDEISHGVVEGDYPKAHAFPEIRGIVAALTGTLPDDDAAANKGAEDMEAGKLAGNRVVARVYEEPGKKKNEGKMFPRVKFEPVK